MPNSDNWFYQATRIQELDEDWQAFFANIWLEPWFINLRQKLANFYHQTQVFPLPEQIFRFLRLTPLKNIKVVWLGQDPYHTPKMANGLAFAVNEKQAIPKSLHNIFKRLSLDLELSAPIQYLDLAYWAQQGICLMNTILTVEAHKARSHADFGWEIFSQKLLAFIHKHQKKALYVGLGKDAQNLIKTLEISAEQFLFRSHPSPLAAHISFLKLPFFTIINAYLKQTNQSPINWLAQ